MGKKDVRAANSRSFYAFWYIDKEKLLVYISMY